MNSLPRGSLGFPKRKRIRKRFEYQRLQRTAQRMVGSLICVDYRLTSGLMPKLGITASGKYGNAVDRNRFKRLAREAFRMAIHELPAGLEINLFPRQRAKKAKMLDIRTELLSLVAKRLHD